MEEAGEKGQMHYGSSPEDPIEKDMINRRIHREFMEGLDVLFRQHREDIEARQKAMEGEVQKRIKEHALRMHERFNLGEKMPTLQGNMDRELKRTTSLRQLPKINEEEEL